MKLAYLAATALVALSGCAPRLPAPPTAATWTKPAADAYFAAATAKIGDRTAAEHYWPAGTCQAPGGMRVPNGEVISWDDVPRPVNNTVLAETFPECPDRVAEKAAAAQRREADAAAGERRKHQFNPDARMPPVSYDMNAACPAVPTPFGGFGSHYRSANACIEGEQAAYDAMLLLWPRLPVFYQEVCGKIAPYSRRLFQCVYPVIEHSEPPRRFRE